MTAEEWQTVQRFVTDLCVEGECDFGLCTKVLLNELPGHSFAGMLKAVDKAWCLEMTRRVRAGEPFMFQGEMVVEGSPRAVELAEASWNEAVAKMPPRRDYEVEG